MCDILHFQHFAKLTADKVVCYSMPVYLHGKPKRNENSLLNLSKEKFKGGISKKTTQNIMSSVKNLLLKVFKKMETRKIKKKPLNRSLSFVTLTLPSKQQHTDNEIKKLCLNQFLIELRKKWAVSDYVWKAEPQQNGNIHFHVLIEKFIPHAELRAIWCRIVEKLGYLSEYQKKHGNKLPPCTEIRAIQKAKNIAKYIGKYMSKKNDQKQGTEPQETSRNIVGKVWATSESLAAVVNEVVEIDIKLQAEIEEFERSFPKKVFKSEHATILEISVHVVNYFKSIDIINASKRFIKKLLNPFENELSFIPT